MVISVRMINPDNSNCVGVLKKLGVAVQKKIGVRKMRSEKIGLSITQSIGEIEGSV